MNRHEGAGHILTHLQAESALFHFELRQLMLTHEVENLFELVEIHQGENLELRVENLEI